MKASELQIGQYAVCGNGKGKKSGEVEKIKPKCRTVVLVRYAGLSNPKPVRSEVDFDIDVCLIEKPSAPTYRAGTQLWKN